MAANIAAMAPGGLSAGNVSSPVGKGIIVKIAMTFGADTPAGPVLVSVPGVGRPGEALMVHDQAARQEYPAQVLADDVLAMVVPEGMAERTITLDLGPVDGGPPSGLSARQTGERVDVSIGGRPFASFRHEEDRFKPIVWPLVGPSGLEMTRAWPMRQDDGTDSRDHPHHQSLWVAHGDVNGVDFWSLAEGHGVQRATDVRMKAGPACVEVDADIDWLDAAGQRVLTERRKVLFWDEIAGRRFVDVFSRLEMTDGPVRFGDTKEGGMCSLRVFPSMEEKRAAGRITNGYGGQGEQTCWGKPAPWCDYSGPVGGRTVGAAILDHPRNFRHPVTWHVRAYGLMGANPFGLSHFANDKSRDGSYGWPKGEAVEYRYRVVLHDGEAATANLDGQWTLFAGGLKVKVLQD